MVVANKGLKDMSNVKNYGQSRVMYGAAAIRFFDDYVALFGAGALYLVYRAFVLCPLIYDGLLRTRSFVRMRLRGDRAGGYGLCGS